MTLRVGFIGYGFMGTAHANALARLPMFFPDAPDIERAVMIGLNGGELSSATDRLGFEESTTEWQEGIEDIDVLYNLGPNFLHPEPSIEALDRDIHVLSEKPLAHTLEAAEEMAAAAQASDAISAVGFNYRFVPAMGLARELIAAGELGEIRAFNGRYLQDWLVDPNEPWTWRNDEELAGSGALGDLGAHTIDLAHFLIGESAGSIERVSGQLKTFVDERPVEDADEIRPVTVDDAFSAQIAFESGAMGILEASRVAASHKNDHSIEIHGSEGSLRFSLERLNELEIHRDGDRGYETILVTEETDPYVEAWWPPGHVLGWEHTIVHEDYEFLRAIAEGESHRPDFDDGLRVQRVLDAIERSDRAGEWVEI